MKSALTRTFLLLSLFCCTAKFYAQLAPSPTLASTNVSEASQYGVLYQLNIPVTANYSSLASVLYSIDNSSLTLNYTRIAYFLQLDNKWVWVSMNKFNTTNAQLGIPYANSGIIYQQVVTGMNVYSSAGAGVTNTTGISGNIEIWPDCYSTGAALGGIGGSASVYDLNDTRSAGTNCFGSFQVHNYGASQTIFAMNNFMSGTLDLGIGNNSGNTNPDWTFMSNAASYTTTRKLWILVQNGITFNNHPSPLVQNACLNGTATALTVSTTVNSGTLTNYQWYSATTATTSGGTLVATHATSLTTDSYTPSTAAAGTLYYYCVANGSGSLTTTSSLSGAYTVGNPTLSISGAGSICDGESITLIASSSSVPSTFTWSSGANTSSILVSPTVTTTYSVSGTTTLGCVGVSPLVTVTVNPLPAISVANGTICNGDSFILSPSGASTYTFSSGSATVSPVTTTNYTISGTNVEGCIGTNTMVYVHVNALPIVSITGTNAVCAGASASLTANGASTYTWSTGSNAMGISVSPALTTTYSLSGTSSVGCVSSSQALNTITVHALPGIAITGANTVCAGSSVGLVASGASTYTWNTGVNTAVINVTPAATTGYSVSGTSVNGCISNSSAVTTVSVNSLPVISITGTNAICAGSSSSLTASGASTYTWSTGSNAAGISVSPAATTSYSVSGSSTAGCISAAPVVLSLSVNALPLISITGTNAVCNGASASLTANGANTYTWSTGSNATGLSVSPTVTTTYSVSGTSSVGCVSSSMTVKTITVYSLPTIVITGANTVCAGSSLALSVSGASTYTWNTGANTSVINVTPSANTVYSLSGTSANGCMSSSSAVTTVSVLSLPVVSISGTNAMCAGASVSLTAGGALTYTWNTGSNSTTITAAPATNTVYSVSGTNSLGCVSATSATHPFTVNALPVLSITANPQVICAGSTASMIANGASTYTWVGIGSLPVMGVSPGVTTNYTLAGTSSLGCAGVPVIRTITVNPLPLVSISATSSICEGGTTNLTAAGAAGYTWTAFGSSTVLAVSPSVTTNYTVTGTSAAGCDNSAIHTLSVNPLPTLFISGSSGICTGQSATLNVSGASTYIWNTGATGSSIVTTPTATTIYTVVGTDFLGCAKTSTQLVTVASSLSISITGPTVVCEGEVFNLTASGGATYTWNTNETTQVITPNPTVATTYSVIGVSGSCSNTAFASVAVNPNPTISISGLTAVCAGDSIILTASGANTYSWSTASNTSTVMITPGSTNIYSVTGHYTTGCSSSAATTVTVYALPTLTLSGDSVLCSGSSLVLTANGASTYTWNTTANTSSITVSPVNTTTYLVIGTDTNGCTNSSSIANVTVNPVPVMNVISSASAVCSGDTITLSASGADTYLWNDGAITSVVIYTPGVTTTYSVTGTNSFACSSTTNIAITVNALPVMAISGQSVICMNESASLNANGASSYTWSTGDISSTLLVAPLTTTSYSITGISAEGCYGTASIQVEVNECTGLASVQISNKVSLYPNPASAVVTIELADATNAEIIIRNVLGQLVVKQKAESITSIQLQELNKGMYYISITKNNGVIYNTSLIKN